MDYFVPLHAKINKIDMIFATIADDPAITPAMRRSIQKARQESARGETIVCHTPEDMQKYFDSL